MKLHVGNVCKTFGAHRVLDGVSLDFDAVQTLALVGPSGGGKSTFLRILAGLEYPDPGTGCRVEIDGERVVYREDALLRHRRTVGTVFQAYNLFPHLTALQNVTLPLEKGSRAVGASRTRHRDGNVAAFPAGRTRAQTPGGTLRRPASARGHRARHRHQAQAVVLRRTDERARPGDDRRGVGIIEELRQEGRDFVLVTHEMGFARRVADQVALLAEGRIVEAGPAAQVFDAPREEASKQFFAKVLRY